MRRTYPPASAAVATMAALSSACRAAAFVPGFAPHAALLGGGRARHFAALRDINYVGSITRGGSSARRLVAAGSGTRSDAGRRISWVRGRGDHGLRMSSSSAAQETVESLTVIIKAKGDEIRRCGGANAVLCCGSYNTDSSIIQQEYRDAGAAVRCLWCRAAWRERSRDIWFGLSILFVVLIRCAGWGRFRWAARHTLCCVFFLFSKCGGFAVFFSEIYHVIMLSSWSCATTTVAANMTHERMRALCVLLVAYSSVCFLGNRYNRV